jgi:hypothetical protein
MRLRGIQRVLIKHYGVVPERLDQHMVSAAVLRDGESKRFGEGNAEIYLPSIRRDA